MTTQTHVAGATRTHSTSFAGTVLLGLAASRQRRALRRLDKAALKDIGVTKAQADAEADRPFWDVPTTWRR